MTAPNHGNPTHWSSEFVLENDAEKIGPVIMMLTEKSSILGLHQQAVASLAIAIEEALMNSIQHGNLEVPSALRDHDIEAFFAMMEQRRSQPPYCDRRVWLQAKVCTSEAVFVIRDEGPGFCLADVPDPRHPGNLERTGGRGILLMHEYMDEVRYNEKGNEVRLVKRR